MKIARIRIRNYRCIREAEIHPATHNVLLGPNNSGKTAVLEAINLVLNPEITFRTNAIDENDFFRRAYLPASHAASDPDDTQFAEETVESDAPAVPPTTEAVESEPAGEDGEVPSGEAEYPTIYIEVVLTELDEEDEDVFSDNLVPWSCEQGTVVEHTEEGVNPFEDAKRSIRVFFEGWFDPTEDDFFHDTFFLPAEGLNREECPRFGREQKRQIGFLIYRDFRALTRPVTLEARSLFGRLMASQEAKPRRFEEVLRSAEDTLSALHADEDFASLLNSYKAELERFLPLTMDPTSNLTFDLTDRTRTELKANAQLYTWDSLPMPIQKMGAGTRSLAILAILSLIMRRRGRGILALEEPETFLFPHAQRRVVDECVSLADQTFVTTHSPFVLERIPIDGVGRLRRDDYGAVSWSPLGTDTVKKTNLYSRFLRKAHCEALVGRGVLVVEGDSDRWWISGVGRILDRETVFNRRQEALELQGIAVTSADGFGEIIRLGDFFHAAGLPVLALFDKLDASELPPEANEASFPCLFHKYKGLEALLAAELPVEKLRVFLKQAPHGKDLPLDPTEVGALSDDALRSNAKKHFEANKGSAFMHEWLISQLKVQDLPTTLVHTLDMIGRHFAEETTLGSATILGI